MRGVEKSAKENGKSRTERHEGDGRDIRQRKTDARETPKREKRSQKNGEKDPTEQYSEKWLRGGEMERKTQYSKSPKDYKRIDNYI